MGLVGPDEPRYAAIGRAMAQSGDWITPRLFGEPWFEKPPLLYWLIAAGFKFTGDREIAPRLPVALLSMAFLAFFWRRVRAVWDARVAGYSTAMLATTAGWMAISRVAITDLPLAALFSAAVLLTMERAPGAGPRAPVANIPLAAAALGLATLAKSLVPLVLFLPVLAVDYKRLREWLRPAPVLAFLAIALPWHILCRMRNGPVFPQVLFVQQQFLRFVSPERQHGQPWWFYVPAFLLLLYPWFPLLGIAARDFRDRRTRILLAVVVFGFLFFSKSLNKLPTYLLPLLPSTCILMGLGLARSPRPARAIVLPVAFIGALPAAARVLPVALATGIGSVAIPYGELALWIAPALVFGGMVAAVPGRRAFAAAVAIAAAAFLWFQYATFPAIDASDSARPLWLATHPACAPGVKRSLVYGLNYYAGRTLPPCALLDQAAARVVR